MCLNPLALHMRSPSPFLSFFFFNDTATTEIYTLSLHDALPIDRPLLVQLFDYYRQLLKGDLGTSLFTTRPVSEDLLARLPATIELTLAAMLIAVFVGIPLGVVSATR